MTSPWSSGADSNSIWNSNSPNLNLLRRYSLRTSTSSSNSNNNNNNNNSINIINTISGSPNNNSTNLATINASKSTCSWEPSVDGKYLVGYIVISRQDLEIYHATLGFQLCGGKLTHDCQLGAIVEHVVPGSLMNIVCKLKVGDEIVEWNGFNLRNKRNDEVCRIIESVKNTNSLRLVAIRAIHNSTASNNNSSTATTTTNNTIINTNNNANDSDNSNN